MPSHLDLVHADLTIKNMVSKSCIKLVQNALEKVDGLEVKKVHLGWVAVTFPAKDFNQSAIDEALRPYGFSVVLDPDERLVQEIKIASIELIHFSYNANSLIRNSDYLSQKLNTPYAKLSKIFSEKTGTKLEKYLILLKIEKVKELITYEEHTLSEISYMMGYSSVQYLSNQFKQVTGVSVTDYKKMPHKPRIPLEDLV